MPTSRGSLLIDHRMDQFSLMSDGISCRLPVQGGQPIDAKVNDTVYLPGWGGGHLLDTHVYRETPIYIQWNLCIGDTLGT